MVFMERNDGDYSRAKWVLLGSRLWSVDVHVHRSLSVALRLPSLPLSVGFLVDSAPLWFCMRPSSKFLLQISNSKYDCLHVSFVTIRWKTSLQLVFQSQVLTSNPFSFTCLGPPGGIEVTNAAETPWSCSLRRGISMIGDFNYSCSQVRAGEKWAQVHFRVYFRNITRLEKNTLLILFPVQSCQLHSDGFMAEAHTLLHNSTL